MKGSPPKRAHEVRLIGGQWKRSKLPVLDAPGLRPSPDRVRETLFNWLGHDLDGWRCLDAFAGTGALGFEAASRGASEAILLERDKRLAAALREVQQRLKAGETVRIEVADAMAWMARCAPDRFEVVFLDPPFDADLFDAAWRAASRIVVPGGYIYLESDAELPEQLFETAGMKRVRHARAGAVHAHLIRRGEDGYTDLNVPAGAPPKESS
jgi:16S rRNA (guanine(966)-N(2))-methyltransferase RsmD